MACAALIALLLTAAVLLSSCSDSPTERGQAAANSEAGASQGVQPEASQTPPAEPEVAAPIAGASESQASVKDVGAPAEAGGRGAAERREARSDNPYVAGTEAHELWLGAPLDRLAVKLSEADGPINLRAGPAIDWPVRRVVETPTMLTIFARVSRFTWGVDTTWLQAQVPDGTVGWLRAERLPLNRTQLETLREVPWRWRFGETVVVRDGAHLHRPSPYRLTDVASAACQIASAAEATAGGRSSDAQWLAVKFDRNVCTDRDGLSRFYGWVPVSHIEPASVVAELPILLPVGNWFVSPDPQVSPINEYAEGRNRPWWIRATEGERVAVLPSPTGEHALIAAGGDMFEDGTTLSVISRGGERVEIGKLYLYHENGRLYPLSGQVHWSPDGRSILVDDFALPYWVGPDAPSFWLYSLEERRSTILAREKRYAVSAQIDYHDARFHHDSGSIYVTKCARSGPRCELTRLTLTGEDRTDFTPIPIDHGYLLSSRTSAIITTAPEVTLLWNERGEPIGERRGSRFHWLPDGEHFAYYTDAEFVIEHLRTGDEVRLKLPAEIMKQMYPLPQWSPDGRHFAIVTTAGFPLWLMELVRIYSLRGELLNVYRTSTCTDLEWLPDSLRLKVSVAQWHCFHGT